MKNIFSPLNSIRICAVSWFMVSKSCKVTILEKKVKIVKALIIKMVKVMISYKLSYISSEPLFTGCPVYCSFSGVMFVVYNLLFHSPIIECLEKYRVSPRYNGSNFASTKKHLFVCFLFFLSMEVIADPFYYFWRPRESVFPGHTLKYEVIVM